ncbi:hypothetical protein B0T20DRAFT_507472 [Sordaria brevicollis]|uniref:Uncharacterized protein n=1 Tax=Sordaria brevicollis TaxID=83679 RepID=A0AAE0PCY9_SORBR|nr:hypothetical protein B0T20DRAFT_507472 [Sordaria brevicollis]
MVPNNPRKEYADKGKGKASRSSYRRTFGPNAEEDAAVAKFYSDVSSTDKQKANEQPYQAADHNTPKAIMINPLPPGNKGLTGSIGAKKEKPVVGSDSKEKKRPYEAADHGTPKAVMVNPLPGGNRGLKGSRWYEPDVDGG